MHRCVESDVDMIADWGCTIKSKVGEVFENLLDGLVEGVCRNRGISSQGAVLQIPPFLVGSRLGFTQERERLGL